MLKLVQYTIEVALCSRQISYKLRLALKFCNDEKYHSFQLTCITQQCLPGALPATDGTVDFVNHINKQTKTFNSQITYSQLSGRTAHAK